MDKRIDEILRDSEYDDEYFVELKKGYCLYFGPQDYQHCFGVRGGMKEIREEMKNVRKCNCQTCQD